MRASGALRRCGVAWRRRRAASEPAGHEATRGRKATEHSAQPSGKFNYGSLLSLSSRLGSPKNYPDRTITVSTASRPADCACRTPSDRSGRVDALDDRGVSGLWSDGSAGSALQHGNMTKLEPASAAIRTRAGQNAGVAVAKCIVSGGIRICPGLRTGKRIIVRAGHQSLLAQDRRLVLQLFRHGRRQFNEILTAPGGLPSGISGGKCIATELRGCRISRYKRYDGEKEETAEQSGRPAPEKGSNCHSGKSRGPPEPHVAKIN